MDRDAPGVDADTGYRRFEDRKLIYFGPGYYDLRKLIGDGTLTVPDGWDVYIAAGAVVYGRIDAWGTGKGTRLRGRGMVYNDENNTAMIFTVTKSTGMEVEGLTFHCHRPQCWQVGVTQCTGVKFDGVKIICTRYASTDGLDVINSQDCTFSNMFIRANDDAVAIKGLQDARPADCLPNRNLLFENIQLWNDCNCAFGMGAETRASAYENIRLRNSCVLSSFDDPDHHEELDERAALTICSLNGTYFSNILYENIDVYHCERLIALGFKPDLREYGTGAEILADLGVRKMILMTNNPAKISGLDGYGIEIVAREPIEMTCNEKNEFYMYTKYKKMGHMLHVREKAEIDKLRQELKHE